MAWNGLISVEEKPSGAEPKAVFLDGAQTNLRRGTGEFSGTIEAITYPDSFHDHILSRKRPPTFGMSYRQTKGDSWKLHLVFNLKISPVGFSHKQFQTDIFSWDFTTLPIAIPYAAKSAHLVIESPAYSWVFDALGDVLYGTVTSDPRLPTPQEVWDIFEANGILRITDNGDGTWTAETDEDGIITMLDSETFEITWPSAVYIDANTYTISTL